MRYGPSIRILVLVRGVGPLDDRLFGIIVSLEGQAG